MAITKGDEILASEVLSNNQAFTYVPFNRRISTPKTGVVFSDVEESVSGEFFQWVRNSQTNNMNIYFNLFYDNLGDYGDFTVRVYDDEDTLIHTYSKHLNGSDRDDSVNYTLTAGLYKITYTLTAGEASSFSQSSVEGRITFYPADITINQFDKIKLYTEDWSDFLEDVELTAILALQGRFTTENGTDVAHGGT